MKTPWRNWQGINDLPSTEYVCGYCGKNVGSAHGYVNSSQPDNHHPYIYICAHCGMPTLFHNVTQTPGPMLGREVGNLPPEIATVYNEIRNSIKDASYTGAILLGRKLLMHLAVDRAGAEEGEKFVQYVDHLQKSGYIPPGANKVLTFIKDLGNEKNHEIKIGTKPEAEKMLKFVEALLIFIYEFPAEVAEGA